MTDVNELKLEHYRQRVLQQEEQIATLRAELTNLNEHLRALQDQSREPSLSDGPIVGGEVVQGEVEEPVGQDVPD